MYVVRLTQEHEEQAEALLRDDPVQNLFLLGFLDASSLARGFWYGVEHGERLTAVALVLPGRLVVPWSPDDTDAKLLGEALRARHPPCMFVGPRAACDAMWAVWGRDVRPERFYDQRLYVCHTPPPGPPVKGFRKAAMTEWRTISRYSALMEYEDLGRDPSQDMPDLHDTVVKDRIRNGRTWVIERGGEILFQINVGTSTPWGCQVGGTYVPPERRGHGLATDGMRELCRQLLPRQRIVTLHVNEANTPAVRVYERSGFERDAPFRLITVRS